MYRLALVAALTSCELPYVPLDEQPPVPSDAALDANPDAAAVVAAPLPVARAPLAVTGLHGAPLRALAVSEDGTVAVSADQRGSLRFWPSLDGKREPVVVAARAAIALAIVHDGDGVAFAAVDDVGQVEVVRLGALGELRARATAHLARPVVEVRPLEHAFLVRCDDGAIVHIDASGTPGGELHPGAHEHVTSLAVRRGGALAIIDAGGKIHGRWIEVAKMRWGKVTPDLDIIGTNVELSPGHGRIAAPGYDGEEIRVIDVTTGTLVYSPVVLETANPLLRPVGFQTDDELAVSFAGGISWSMRPYPALINEPFANGVAAVGDAGVVADIEGGLAVRDADAIETEYLGYQLAAPTRLRALRGGGWLATDSRIVAAIDGDLHTARGYKLADVATVKYGIFDVRFIDDHHVIALLYENPGQGIYLFGLEDGSATSIATATGVVDYDEAHGVLAFRSTNTIAFARYDGKTGTFGAQATLQLDGNSSTVRFLDPSASSDVAVVVDASYQYDQATTATITHVHAVHADGTIELGKVRRMKLGRDWWRTNGNPDSLAGPTPAATTPYVHASPDGKLVAVLAGARVILRDASGRELWSSPSLGASELAWGKDGALVATGAGMARYDLATGDVTAVQCGWRFGRSNRPPSAGIATMCEQSWTATE